MVHKIIPHDFFNVDLEDNKEDEKKQLAILRYELEKLKQEKNNQSELKAIRFNSLLVLRQMRGQFTEKEFQNYEAKINTVSSREEIEVVVKEFLLKAKEKIIPPRPNRENEDKKTGGSSVEIDKQNQILIEKIKFFSAEIDKLKKEIKDLQKPERENKILLVVVIMVLMIGGVYGIIKLLTFFWREKNSIKIKKNNS